MEPQRRRCFVQLEALRGIAALIVVVYHVVWTNPVTARRLFQNGPLMVDFFFVLSGFVICHSYGMRLSNRWQIKRFLWLRAGRVYPLHLAMLLVFLTLELARHFVRQHLGILPNEQAFTIHDGFALVTNLLLIQSLGIHHSLTYNYPSWSISTEFYTYILFALVRAATGEGSRYILAAVAIVAASFGVLFAVGVHSLADATYNWGLFRCCGGFFLGTLAWHIYASLRQRPPRHPEPSWTATLAPLSLLAAVVFLGLANPSTEATYAFPWLAALIVLAIVCWPAPLTERVLTVRPLRYLGQVSYSVYMVHAAIVWLIAQLLTAVFDFPRIRLDNWYGIATPAAVGMAVLVLYAALVLISSAFSYRFIENPFRRKSRDFARQITESATTGAHPDRGATTGNAQ